MYSFFVSFSSVDFFIIFSFVFVISMSVALLCRSIVLSKEMLYITDGVSLFCDYCMINEYCNIIRIAITMM